MIFVERDMLLRKAVPTFRRPEEVNKNVAENSK